MDMHQKQRCINEFLHADQIELIHNHQRLGNIYEADAVAVSKEDGFVDSGVATKM